VVPVALDDPADSAVDIDALWAALWTRPGPPLTPDDRPSVTAVMVSSVDGHVTEGGRVGALTGPPDQAVLHQLRMIHDAVLVGATTVRVEGYDALLTPSEQAQRIDAGESAQPILCILSARGALDAAVPALQAEDLPVAVLTAMTSSTDSLPNHVNVIRADSDASGELDIPFLFHRLRTHLGVRRLLCEGGPTLIGSLVRGGLLDELILVMSPRVSGGDGLRAIASAGAKPRSLELLAHAVEDGFAFLRYRFVHEATP
jgi:riboflavin biosynthesis pyrimidine reductase